MSLENPIPPALTNSHALTRIALGIGVDPSFRAPMAIVVIGGLITSTFLSLLVIPVVFTYIDDLAQLIGRQCRMLPE